MTAQWPGMMTIQKDFRLDILFLDSQTNDTVNQSINQSIIMLISDML